MAMATDYGYQTANVQQAASGNVSDTLVDAQDKFVCRGHVELDFSFTCRLQSAELEHLTLLFYLILT